MTRRLTSVPKPAARVRPYISIRSRPPGTRSPYFTPSYRARLEEASAGAMT